MTLNLGYLPPVGTEEREALLAGPRTTEHHRAIMARVPAMAAVQSGGTHVQKVLPAELTVAAWNLERCLFPLKTSARLFDLSPDVLLLSEVDHGMARTAQRHTTEDIAQTLGMAYIYGVEFHELGLGDETERHFCKDDFNLYGWHGNAILSKAPLSRVKLVRLDDHGHWYTQQDGAGNPTQPRLGGRMALLAETPTEAGPICVVSTHLESNSGAEHRAEQFQILMDAVDEFAPGLPVLIGGDLNTGNHLPPDFDWRNETLFAQAEARGYDWSFTAEGNTTRPSLITPHPTRKMKLDWIAGRGFTPEDKGILSSLTPAGKPLSDHDCVWSVARLSKLTLVSDRS